MRRKASSRKRVDRTTVPPALAVIRVAIGPVFVLGGAEMMPSYFWWGDALVYVGLFLCLLEVIYEPLLGKREAVQIVGVGLVFVFSSIFTIKVTGAKAPISVVAYSGGEHAPEAQIAGIGKWNQKFADTRVALNDPSSDDYQDLSILMNPNAWTYKAAIVDESSGCTLSVEPGNALWITRLQKGGGLTITGTNTFGQFGVHDSSGNSYEPLAYQNGYRLFCGSFPSHFTIQIIFASVTPNDDLLTPLSLPKLKGGEWGLSAGEFKPNSSQASMWDFLGHRPRPSVVRMTGSYKNGARTYSIDKTVRIDN